MFKINDVVKLKTFMGIRFNDFEPKQSYVVIGVRDNNMYAIKGLLNRRKRIYGEVVLELDEVYLRKQKIEKITRQWTKNTI